MESSCKEELPIVYVTKKLLISCAHRLYCNELSEDENYSLYEKCAGIHGHNYVVRVTLRGPVDAKTGMLINIVDLKHAMEECIKKPMDHNNLENLPYFKDRVSTGENIAVYIWEQLEVALGPKANLLCQVSLEETENNTFVYKGEKTS